MTAALLWKEYRQQRAIWVVIAALAAIVVVGVAEVLGKGSGLEVFRDGHIVDILYGAVVALAMAQGIVTGAALLAGDKEDGTLGFLEGLTGLRGPLFARKLAAGVMITLSQSLFLAVLALCLGFGTFRYSRNVLLLPLFALDGLIWGLLAGAMCRTVLIAILVGFALMGASWPLALSAIGFVHHFLGLFGFGIPRQLLSSDYIVPGSQAVAAVAGAFASCLIYCRSDLSRRQSGTQLRSRFFSVAPSGWRTLLWLVIRQGRWVLCGCIAGAVLLACFVGVAPDILWPTGTLLLGLTCGLAAFAPDSKDGNQFLAAQRFPVGRLWIVKVGFWAAVAAAATALARKGYGYKAFAPSVEMFFLIWPIYGFCFGQFFGLVAGRPLAALVLAVFITPLVTAMWAPSLYFGGVALWQVLIIPGLLLIFSRLAAWPAVVGRLYTFWPAIGIAGTTGLMTLTTAGFFWHRAVEIPDVGEPFDVEAFTASLPTVKENRAGPMVSSAARSLGGRLTNLSRDFETYRELHSILFHSGLIASDKQLRLDVHEINRLLDDLFRKEWAESARAAARLPLSMIQDPRVTDMRGSSFLAENSHHIDELMDSDYAFAISSQNYISLTRCFVARALQMRVKGDFRGALDQLETALGLSRQVKNFASSRLFEVGCEMEILAIGEYQRWLKEVGPDKELLKSGLEMLQRHGAVATDPADAVKADYLIRCNGLPPFDRKLANVFQSAEFELPWENQRRQRIDRAVTLARLRECQKDPRQRFEFWEKLGSQKNEPSSIALIVGMPIKEADDLSIGQWSEAIARTSNQYYTQTPWFAEAISRRTLHGVQLVTALALYQADLGKLPAKLDDLSPIYLPVVPIDSFRGEPFEFTIVPNEKGFRLPTLDPYNKRTGSQADLVPGQFVVWAKMKRLSGLQPMRLFQSWELQSSIFPVPMWKK